MVTLFMMVDASDAAYFVLNIDKAGNLHGGNLKLNVSVLGLDPRPRLAALPSL